ncbi:MAG: hypothetical protein AAF215_17840 [Cyanobacteria bacterium P01_A01_bin.123]
MLIPSSHQAQTPSVKRLIEIWGKRYVPNLSSISAAEDTVEFRQRLIDMASPVSRGITAAKITKNVVAIKCQMASLQTRSLYSYLSNVVNLSDARRLSEFALLIYLQLAEIYQQSSLSTADQVKILYTPRVDEHDGSVSSAWESLSMEDWGMTPIEQLAIDLEPLLIEFQQQHILSKNWRTLGFLTTLLNFCNKLLLQNLSKTEQLLIYPYFRFVEEQVALPWQRVCLAASRHALDSPQFAIVEHCLPQSQAIAHEIHNQLRVQLPDHYSRRGHLSNPEVAHSSIRDQQMIQAYFWLSFLEESLSPIEDELVPLFAMVNPAIGIKWEFMALSNQLLFGQILTILSPAQADLVSPYVNGFIHAFASRKSDFEQVVEGAQAEAQIRAHMDQEKVIPLPQKPEGGQLQVQATSQMPQAIVERLPQKSEEAVPHPNIAALKAKLAQLESEISDIHKQLDV